MVIEDMECLRAVVVATSLSTHERFTHLAEMSPFQRAAPLRARRMSTNEGPIFSTNLRAMQSHQHIVDEVVQQLGLDWRVQELQQDNCSRAGSRPRSRASSMSRNSSESGMPGLVRSNSWGRLSRANSVGNLSQRSGQSGRSSGGHSNRSRAMSFKGPDLNQRLQMRNAWMRQRDLRARGRGRGRGRGGNRGRGGYIQWNQQRGRWNNPQWRWGWQQRRQQWGRPQWGRQQWGRQQQGSQPWLRRWGNARSDMPPLTPRGRAGQENPGYVQKRGFAGRRGRGRGRGSGRGGQNTGVSQNSMPPLKTKEQLDKELEEYMASTPASLDKELDQYMAQSGLSMDSD